MLQNALVLPNGGLHALCLALPMPTTLLRLHLGVVLTFYLGRMARQVKWVGMAFPVSCSLSCVLGAACCKTLREHMA